MAPMAGETEHVFVGRMGIQVVHPDPQAVRLGPLLLSHLLQPLHVVFLMCARLRLLVSAEHPYIFVRWLCLPVLPSLHCRMS